MRGPVAFSYKRFSSKRQEKGDTVRRQGSLSESWSQRSGVRLDASLKLDDNGVSAFRGRNRHIGALGRFLALAKEGVRVQPGDYLVVEALDRLSRQSAYIALPIITELVEAGVRIVNLDLGSGRDQIIDHEELTKHPHVLIMILLEFVRAHEESMKKSLRVREWRAPRLVAARVKKVALAQRVPGWIRRIGDRFELIPEHALLLQRAINMAIGGMAPVSIAKTFNQEKQPIISGRSTTTAWHYSVVRFYLRTRLLLGEYQPTTITEEGVRVPVGDPIPEYYPTLIDEPMFYRLQAAMDVRAKGKRKGREGKNIANLFCRLLINGNDRTTCYLVQKRKQNINLISALMVQGTEPVVSFPYEVFERAFLQWVSEITIEASRPSDLRDAEVDGRLAEVTRRITEVESHISSSANMDFSRLVRVLAELEKQESSLKQEAEIAKREMSRPSYDTSDIVKLADSMPGLASADLQEVRSRLRLAIASVVDRVEIFPTRGVSPLVRHAGVIVWLRNGLCRIWELRSERGRRPLTVALGRGDLRWEAEAPDHLSTLVAQYVQARALLPYHAISQDPFADTEVVTLPFGHRTP